MAATATTISWLDTARMLGLRLVGVSAADRAAPALTAAVRAGLPYSAIEALGRASGLPTEVIVSVLRIPPRTLARRKATRQLSAEESDRLSRVARTAALALSVFEQPDRASSWLTASNRALGGAAPVSLLDTDIGAAQVDEVLRRIQHGIFS